MYDDVSIYTPPKNGLISKWWKVADKHIHLNCDAFVVGFHKGIDPSLFFFC